MLAKNRLWNITKLNYTYIQHKGKYFEDQEIFCMKLTFKTKEHEPDFTRALRKVAKFHIFPLGGIRVWPSRQQVKEGMHKNS